MNLIFKIIDGLLLSILPGFIAVLFFIGSLAAYNDDITLSVFFMSLSGVFLFITLILFYEVTRG